MGNLIPVNPTLEGFSPQEKRVMVELAADKSTKQIALAMGIETCTVRTYVFILKTKLGVGTREMLLPKAIELGLFAWHEDEPGDPIETIPTGENNRPAGQEQRG